MTGYGESTQLRGRSYESLVGDIEDLANALGVDKFYIAAVSGGGPYALATAAQLPLRVKGVLLLSAAGSPGLHSALETILHPCLRCKSFSSGPSQQEGQESNIDSYSRQLRIPIASASCGTKSLISLTQ